MTASNVQLQYTRDLMTLSAEFMRAHPEVKDVRIALTINGDPEPWLVVCNAADDMPSPQQALPLSDFDVERQASIAAAARTHARNVNAAMDSDIYASGAGKHVP